MGLNYPSKEAQIILYSSSMIVKVEVLSYSPCYVILKSWVRIS